MWLLSTRAAGQLDGGTWIQGQSRGGHTHIHTHICVQMYAYEWPAYTGYLKLWNWVWREEERAKLNLKVYEDWQVKRPRKLPELRRREEWGRRTVKDSTACWGLRYLFIKTKALSAHSFIISTHSLRTCYAPHTRNKHRPVFMGLAIQGNIHK